MMKISLSGSLTKILFAVLVIFLPSQIFAQEQCFSSENVNKIIASIESPLKTENKKIRRELLKMQETQKKANIKAVENWEKEKKFDAEAKQIGKENSLNLCRMLSENGWLTKDAIEADGFDAFLYLIRNTRDFQIQKAFVPILSAAAKKGLIEKELLASTIDKIRLAAGLPQIFGTQLSVKDEIGYLYPLQNEEKVEEWRKLYDLPSLKTFLKEMEVLYQTPIIKMPQQQNVSKSAQQANASLLEDENLISESENDEDEIINIETKLVSLNVRVLNRDSKAIENLNLMKDDFQVFENGQNQEISFFSATDSPFDLILMLDLSGSTSEKRDVIEKSARRFIEAVRPKDRISIVTFTHNTNVIADFTDNKQLLYQKLKNLDDEGGSKIWDAIEFVYENVIKPKKDNRRTAIVLMTDGVDNSLVQSPTIFYVGKDSTASLPSKITLNDLLETIRQNDTTIFSIYVDNEYTSDEWSKKAYRQARRTMELFADESGGGYYYARKLKDLNGIYEQILNDLNKVYSLSYEPKNEFRDNSWRNLTVKIKDRPNLIAKTKSGYYAK
jgi:VWFA-related protein